MYCTKCGTQIQKAVSFCPACGAPLIQPGQYSPPPAPASIPQSYPAPPGAPLPGAQTNFSLPRKGRSPVSAFLTAAMLACLTLFFVSWHMKNRLPDSSQILPELKAEPLQTPTDTAPFTVTKDNITYTVSPKFEYDIYGLVVTYHESRSWFDISHKEWGDVINIKDLCVVWGGNTDNDLYKQIKFTSSDFTCDWFTKDYQVWKAFNKSGASNNHLITEDPRIAKAIFSVLKGDQVRVKGFLAEYSNDKGFHRGTSTTRDDTRNGACETIYVTDIQVLKSNNHGWDAALKLSGFAFLLFAALSVVWFIKSAAP